MHNLFIDCYPHVDDDDDDDILYRVLAILHY